jgi:PAS domain S-box-containing protein
MAITRKASAANATPPWLSFVAILAATVAGLFAIRESIAGNKPGSPHLAYALVCVVAAILLMYVSFLSDHLTKKKLLNDALNANEHLRMALSSSDSVAWDFELKTGINTWIGDLRGIFGIDSETFTARVGEFYESVHPDDRHGVAQAVARARANKAEYFAEFRIIRKDNSIRWISARGSFSHSKAGIPERMVGVAMDITDRKLAEEALRESEERFRLVANTAPVMIWMSGPDKLCTYVNKRWLEFTGKTIDTELGDGWSAGIHPEDMQRTLSAYYRAFDARETFQAEYRLRRHDGQYRWILDTGVSRNNPDGSFAGYIGSAKDVTDRKAAEEMLASVGRRLIEAHEEERAWIGRELHDDVNQRLALLAVELDQWEQRATGHRTTDTLNIQKVVRHAQERIGEIAKDVQDLSHRLHPSKLDYLGLAAAAGSFCRDIAQGSKVRVNFSHHDIPRNLPKEIGLSFYRVLQEALQNAVRHSGAKEFDVRLAYTSGRLELTVADHGRGFGPHDAANRQGLGLISMRERLQLVNGDFSLESTLNSGTTIQASVHVREDQIQPEDRKQPIAS